MWTTPSCTTLIVEPPSSVAFSYDSDCSRRLRTGVPFLQPPSQLVHQHPSQINLAQSGFAKVTTGIRETLARTGSGSVIECVSRRRRRSSKPPQTCWAPTTPTMVPTSFCFVPLAPVQSYPNILAVAGLAGCPGLSFRVQNAPFHHEFSNRLG